MGGQGKIEEKGKQCGNPLQQNRTEDTADK